jgi:hypothetical protein
MCLIELSKIVLAKDATLMIILAAITCSAFAGNSFHLLLMILQFIKPGTEPRD